MDSSRHHDLGVSTQKSPSKVKFSEDVNVSVVQTSSTICVVSVRKTNNPSKIKDMSNRLEIENKIQILFKKTQFLLTNQDVKQE